MSAELKELGEALAAIEMSVDAVEMGKAVPELTQELVEQARRDCKRAWEAFAKVNEQVRGVKQGEEWVKREAVRLTDLLILADKEYKRETARLRNWAFLWKNCATRWRDSANLAHAFHSGRMRKLLKAIDK